MTATETKLRVAIVDDHVGWRAAVSEALTSGGFEVCGEADNAEGAVELALRERPDVLLLDINMPGGGIAAAGAVSLQAPEIAIVMLTISRTDDDLFEALKAGARGYLVKDIDPDRLPHALNGVIGGEAALPRPMVARLISEFQRRERYRRLLLVNGSRPQLTEREWDVLDAMADGATTAEIAERLFVSKVTVRTHISALLKKLGVNDREAAIEVARNRVELDDAGDVDDPVS